MLLAETYGCFLIYRYTQIRICLLYILYMKYILGCFLIYTYKLNLDCVYCICTHTFEVLPTTCIFTFNVCISTYVRSHLDTCFFFNQLWITYQIEV